MLSKMKEKRKVLPQSLRKPARIAMQNAMGMAKPITWMAVNPSDSTQVRGLIGCEATWLAFVAFL